MIESEETMVMTEGNHITEQCDNYIEEYNISTKCNAITRSKTKEMREENGHTHQQTEEIGEGIVSTEELANRNDTKTTSATEEHTSNRDKTEYKEGCNWMENLSLDQIREAQHKDKILEKRFQRKRKAEPPDKLSLDQIREAQHKDKILEKMFQRKRKAEPPDKQS